VIPKTMRHLKRNKYPFPLYVSVGKEEEEVVVVVVVVF
jgi:hypothetical protein